jgi:hypothetical protein
MMMVDFSQFREAVVMARMTTNKRKKDERRAFNTALIEAARMVNLDMLGLSFPALLGAIDSAAAACADPEQLVRLEAKGRVMMAADDGKPLAVTEDLVVAVPAPTSPTMAAALEAQGFRCHTDLRRTGKICHMWEGRAVEADVVALIAPFGGVVNRFIFPAMHSDPARNDDARIVVGGALGADHAPDLAPDFSAEGVAFAQPEGALPPAMKSTNRRRKHVIRSADAASNVPPPDADDGCDVLATEGPVPHATKVSGAQINAVDDSGPQPQSDSISANSEGSPLPGAINFVADHDGDAPPAVASFPEKGESAVEVDVQRTGGDVGGKVEGNAPMENPNLQAGDEAIQSAASWNPNGG